MREGSCFRVLLSVVVLLALAGGAAAEGTAIRDVLKLDGGCTLTISPRDHQFCDGSTDSVTAAVSCGAGYVQVRPPEWFLDGVLIGRGNGLRFSAAEGSHVLSASCGSCTDQINLTVLPTSACAYLPDLVAAFSDSATESSTGVFQQANIAVVTPANFSQLKYLMRPVTLSASAAPAEILSGGYVLSQTGTNLQLFRTDGTLVPLPDTLHQSDLPLSLLVNATSLGASTLIATYDSSLPAARRMPPGERIFSTASDSVAFRVGQFPGLAGRSLGLYPWFEFMRSINDSGLVKVAIDPTRHLRPPARGAARAGRRRDG